MYPPPQQFTPVYAAPIHHQHHHTSVNPKQHPTSPPSFISPSMTLQYQVEFPQLDSGLVVPKFQQGEDPINCINKAMTFLSAVASRFPPSNNQLRTSSNPRNQATIQDGRVTVQQVQGRQHQSYVGTGNSGIATTSKGNVVVGNAAWFKEKLMLAEAQKEGQILDEEKLSFLADLDDLDAYDSDCDDLSSAKAVLMANLSSYDPEFLSEVPYSDSYSNDMINQDVQVMQYSEQIHVDDFEDNEIHSGSNIIPYSQYLQETQDAVIQDTNPSTPNDLLVLYLVEQITNYVDSKMDDLIRDRNAKLTAFQQEIDTLKETLSNNVKENESLSKTLTVFKTEYKEKESKYIDKEIVLEKQNKELENIISLGYQNPFHLKKDQRIQPTLYDGSVIAKEHAMISVNDDEETLILEEESRSKMLDKQNDPILIEKKIKISPIDYSKLNKNKEDFGKRFVTQKELSTEQAFWLKHSTLSETPVTSHTPVRIKAPSELSKVSLVNESLKKLKYQLANFDKVVKKRLTSDAITAGSWGFEHTKECFLTEIIPFLKVLKDTFNAFDKTLLDEITKVQTVFNQMEAVVDQCSVDKKVFKIQIKQLRINNDQLLKQIMSQEIMHIVANSVDILNVKKPQENDTVIRKLKERIKSLSRKDSVENVKKDIDEIETINIELEHSVAKLLSENENLRKEREHLKSIFKDQFSIGKIRVQSKKHCDSLIAQINAKSVENSDLNAQLQGKVFAITTLKNELRKLKGKNIVNTAISKLNATLALGMFKLDIEPISPSLENNRDAHEELLVYVSQTCPSSPKSSGRVKPTTSASGSKPSGNTKNNRITRPPRSNQKNKVKDHLRKVKSSFNKTNFVSEPISNALVKHSVRNAKFESMCAIYNKCLFDANHDMCLVDFVNDVNVRLKYKSKRNKKKKSWKPTGKVFTDVGYKWKPAGRFFTIVGSSCPLTRITPKKIVHLKETTSKSVETPKPEIKVYSRRPKLLKIVGSSKKAKIVESKIANNSEPTHLWGSNAIDFHLRLLLSMTGCPDRPLSNVVRIKRLQDILRGNVAQLQLLSDYYCWKDYADRDEIKDLSEKR
ncbi:hypothetical protein Tco_1174799 [Tanacetum coccineum]